MIERYQVPEETDSGVMNFGDFEFLPTSGHHLFFDVDSAVTLTGQFAPTGMPLPHSSFVESLIFLLLLLSMVIFSLIFRKEGMALTANFRHIFSLGRPVQWVHKEQVTLTEAWGEFFMVVQTIVVLSILLFSYMWERGLSTLSFTGYSLHFLLLFAALSVFIALKLLIYKIIGTFFLQKEMKRWITQYTRIVELLGLILFLPAIIYLYLHEFREVTLFFLVIVFLMSRLVIAVALFNIFADNKVGSFYFFVYLCGTEIAPYILFYEGVLSIIRVAANIIV